MHNYRELEKAITQIFLINNAVNMLYWDIATNMPSGAAESRKHEIMNLSSIAHSMLTSNKLEDLIKQALEETCLLDMWQLRNLHEIERRRLEASCIDDGLQKRFVASTTECELIWREARKDNDYSKFKPYLQEVLSSVREVAKAKAARFNCGKYDALIDKYDPERKADEIKQVYNILKEKIPFLIQNIVEKQCTEKVLPIDNRISIEEQKNIGKRVMQIMGFDFTSGRLDESAHPFCGGTSHDVRLTTRYDENDFISGLMGIVHETGHGLYEQSLPFLYKDQPVGKAKGMAVHESQSLFMEMQIGRSREFTEFLARLLRDEFSLKGSEYSSENLYKLITRVKPDFIRVDADEVTYSMHVILRFELEELLINDELTLDDLPAYWDSRMQEYLGITPNTVSKGCMQDIHWSMGHFGYFPAYINGAIIASMLMATLKEQHVAIAHEITKGDFVNVNTFLNNKIRNYGSLKTTSRLVQDATGEESINPEIFLRYLEQKYLG